MNNGLWARQGILVSRWIAFLAVPVGLVMVGVGASIASAEQRPMTPADLAKIRTVLAAEISPDGRHVSYVLNVPRRPFEDDDGPAWTELHVVDADGASRPYVTGEVNVEAVTWRPDGMTISFLTKRGMDKTKAVYQIPMAGGEATPIVTFDTDISEYSWCADGKRIAFIAKEKKGEAKEKQEKKGFKQEVYEEDYAKPCVWIAEVGTGLDKPRPLDLPGFPSELHWSPVGSHIALALAPTPLIDDHYMRRKVHIFDADSGAIVSSFPNPGKLGKIAWSPDGRSLAVVSAADLNDPSEGRLLLASPTDGSLRDLLPKFEGHVELVAWQEVDTVMFLAGEGVWTTFGEVRGDGTARKTHIPTGKVSGTSFSLSADGQAAAFVLDSPAHPGEVFLMRHGDPGPRRLTTSNPWLSEIKLAKQEVIRFNARDGLPLEGLLIHPLDEESGKRYPLLLRVHGGPESHDRNGWLTVYHSPGQIGAGMGYAVFYPNYRGSTGRGIAYSKLSQGDPAGKEFDDLVDAVDHLVKMGLVDEKRVGITGGSYGGFATAWGATYYSDRFAAAVMAVGISDIIAKSGTTDIPNEEADVHALKRPWDDWEGLLKRSPIYHVQKAKTPLLILHGKDDTRVHPSQSLELYRFVKEAGAAPVRLVWYPGEGHGNRKAAGRLDYNIRMMQWFEHYLKGSGGEPPPYELDYGQSEEKGQTKGAP